MNLTQKDLVDGLLLRIPNISPNIKRILLTIDRAEFVDPDDRHYAHDDMPRPLESERGNVATISAPHMHAYALKYLEDRLFDGAKVLDVGSGSGYLTACFAVAVNCEKNPESLVVGQEIDNILVKNSIIKMKHALPWTENSKNVIIEQGNSWNGWNDRKFDAIHVGAAPEHLPIKLLESLNEGGKCFFPFGPLGYQTVALIERTKKEEDLKGRKVEVITDTQSYSLTRQRPFEEVVLKFPDLEGYFICTRLFDVSYVPLVDEPVGQKKHSE